MKKLPLKFYKRKDVLLIAKELIGKVLVTNFEGILTSGRIVETEAYVAHTDRASHAFEGKRTIRNDHMYCMGGCAYVYICYGMHHMFNVVTNAKGVPDAVLIRAIEPLEGISEMLKRTGKQKKMISSVGKGPGNVGKALGIFKYHSGINLIGDKIYILADSQKIDVDKIACGPRIGVESSGVDALLPYRFYLLGNKFVSRKNT